MPKQVETGDKVYVWGDDDNPIIGEVLEVIPALNPDVDPDICMIKSILDDNTYMEDIKTVFHVGTGPVMEKKIHSVEVEDLFEDIEDDPENVLMNIPPTIMASLGLDIGDTLVIECVSDKLVLRKKETHPTKEYETARGNLIDKNVPPEFD